MRSAAVTLALPPLPASGRRPARRALHPLWLVAAASLWMATVANAALWRELRHLELLQGAAGAGFAAGLALAIAACVGLVLLPVAAGRALKPALALALLAAAAAAHFMLSYGVVIDAGMMRNVLQTDVHEAADLLGLRFALTVLALGVLPAAALWRCRVRALPWRAALLQRALASVGALLLVVAAGLAVFQPLASATRNHKQLRYLVNPLNVVYALGRLAAGPKRGAAAALAPLGSDAVIAAAPGARPPLVLLVLGETARAGNFGLNGYARPTTPELAALPGVVSFTNAWSCGTSTAASLPCMFSGLGRTGYEHRDRDQEDLLDVLQHAGLAVLWLDNQAGCKGVCDRVPHAQVAAEAHGALCAGGECLDEALLAELDGRIAALPAERRARGVVVVLHQMGSHGPAYAKRSPPAYKRFAPECASAALQDCSAEQVRNAYDNSIAYTDHVLAQAIRWLDAKRGEADTALVYVSDHGESLGENNLYLHGLPYGLAPDVQKRVPWITWLSPGYARRRGTSGACLQAARDAPVSHDHYFHSVLGLLDVRTAAYRRELDAYAGCRNT